MTTFAVSVDCLKLRFHGIQGTCQTCNSMKTFSQIQRKFLDSKLFSSHRAYNTKITGFGKTQGKMTHHQKEKKKKINSNPTEGREVRISKLSC